MRRHLLLSFILLVVLAGATFAVLTFTQKDEQQLNVGAHYSTEDLEILLDLLESKDDISINIWNEDLNADGQPDQFVVQSNLAAQNDLVMIFLATEGTDTYTFHSSHPYLICNLGCEIPAWLHSFDELRSTDTGFSIHHYGSGYGERLLGTHVFHYDQTQQNWYLKSSLSESFDPIDLQENNAQHNNQDSFGLIWLEDFNINEIL